MVCEGEMGEAESSCWIPTKEKRRFLLQESNPFFMWSFLRVFDRNLLIFSTDRSAKSYGYDCKGACGRNLHAINVKKAHPRR